MAAASVRQGIFLGIAFGVLLVTPSSAAPPLPKAGTVLKADAARIGPWQITGRGFWCPSFSKDCSYAILKNGSDIVLAVTKATIVNPDGGYKAEAITKTFTVRATLSEEDVDCDGGPPETVLSLLNIRAKTVRHFWIKNGGLASRVQKYAGHPPCDLGP
jgi:hypothetical protein